MAEGTSRVGEWFRGLTPGGARARQSETTALKEAPDEETPTAVKPPTEEKPPTGAKTPEEKPTAAAVTGAPEATKEKAPTEEKAAPPTDKPKPPPDMQGRIDGIQGWAAEIERKQGRMTYFGAVAAILALALSGAALYFAITAKNDTSSDIDALREDVDGIQRQVEESTATQLKGINDKLTSLEQQATTLDQRAKQNESDIAELQTQRKKGLGGTTVTPALPTPTPPAVP